MFIVPQWRRIGLVNELSVEYMLDQKIRLILYLKKKKKAYMKGILCLMEMIKECYGKLTLTKDEFDDDMI